METARDVAQPRLLYHRLHPKASQKRRYEDSSQLCQNDIPLELVPVHPMGSTLLVRLPYLMETNYFSLLLTRNHSPREFTVKLEGLILQVLVPQGGKAIICLNRHIFVARTPMAVCNLDGVSGRLRFESNIKWKTARKVTEAVSKRGNGLTGKGHPRTTFPRHKKQKLRMRENYCIYFILESIQLIELECKGKLSLFSSYLLCLDKQGVKVAFLQFIFSRC